MNGKTTKGFTLIEVLVALLVLSIGLLGLAALQAISLGFNTESYTRTQATLLAYEIVDKMRANPAAVAAGAYDVPTLADATAKISSYGSCGASCQCVGNSCTSDNLALYDLGTWYNKMNSPEVLPGASDPNHLAIISRDGTNLLTITIEWRERDLWRSQQWSIQL